jgi:dTDP-4-amino-4,6-dideoxygalactose transaminase
VLTHQGRSAVALGCRALGLGPGDEVLVPSYNCGTEVEAVRAAGPAPVLYRVDAAGRIDAGDVRARITPRTRAIYVIHYFGWPQDTGPLLQLARERGLALVEDCALALFSERPDGPLGRDGDAAIFSFRKSLPVPDGGALVLKDALPRGLPPLPPPSAVRVVRRCVGLVRRRHATPRSRGPEFRHFGPAHPDMPGAYYWEETSARWAISGVTLGILGQIAPGDVVARRRANYARLLRTALTLRGARPLFPDLPPGVCPTEFPLVAEDRDGWVAALRGRGVAAVAWWSGYHRALSFDAFPEACELKDCVVALPVHQDLDAAAMERLAQALEDVADAIAYGPRSIA